MRSSGSALLVFALHGCASPAIVASDAAAPADAPTPRPPCEVSFDPVAPLRARTSEQVIVRTRVRPAQYGTEVRFGLVGDAGDASLSATRALTDADGVASLVLIAPSSPAAFRLRASLGCGAEGFQDVSVGDRGFGSVSVAADYRGARAPSSVLVSLFRASDCASLPAEPDRSITLSPQGGSFVFSALPAGIDYAVRAVALGGSRVSLATGCDGPLHVETDRTTASRIVFNDVPLRFGALYDLSLRYDLSSLAAVSAAGWRDAAAAEVARAGGDGGLLGGELTESVVGAALPAERDLARMQFMQLLAAGLSNTLTTQLSRRGASIDGQFARLSELVAAVLANARSTCVLRAAMDGERETLVQVERVEFTLDPSTPEVSRDDVVVPVRDGGTGRLGFGLGDGIDVSLRAFSAPYARLELNALGALLGRLGMMNSAAYVSASVCPIVTSLVRGQTGLCDDACVATACRRAISRVGAAFEVALTADGSARNALDLGFSAMGAALPAGLTVDHASGPAVGAFVGETGASVSAIATLSARPAGS